MKLSFSLVMTVISVLMIIAYFVFDFPFFFLFFAPSFLFGRKGKKRQYQIQNCVNCGIQTSTRWKYCPNCAAPIVEEKYDEDYTGYN